MNRRNDILLIDYSQLVISSYMVLAYQSYDKTVELDMVRYVALNGLRNVITRFKHDYGDPVIAVDSRKGSWRKKVFPYYKAQRSDIKKKSEINWPELLRFINDVKQELIEVFPYKVIEVDYAEADDIIAVLTRTSVKENRPTLIVSRDKDFIQLQIGSNLVSQWDKKNDVYVGVEDPKRYLFEHVLGGDRGDGIPNVLSPADAFVNRIRQKRLTQKRIDDFWEDPTPLKTNDRFLQNLKVIDFKFIPKDLEEQILDKYHSYEVNSRTKLHDYFVSKRLKSLYEHLKDF